MAVSKLDSNTVFSSDDNDVGKVKEIMLDVRSGRIAYIVLSSGGFLGMGDKLLAIPWHALTLDMLNKYFRLSISSEKIKNATGFDKNNWPSMTDHVWAGSVHQFYGSEQYPGREVPSSDDNLPGPSSTVETRTGIL
jgi:hypothetical protein